MNKKPIPWQDAPTDTKKRKVMAAEQIGVPGIRMMGHHNAAHAIPALHLHYHKDSFEFTYFIHGNAQFAVDDQTYPLTGGDLFVTFPNEVHDSGAAPMTIHQMYWFQLEADDPAHFLYLPPTEARELIDLLWKLPNRVMKPNANETAALLSMVFRCFWDGSPVKRMEGAHLLTYFLYRLVECGERPQSSLTPDIIRTTDYILEHIAEELPMADLARVALLSESRFKQKFKLQLGTSPRDYVNFHKIAAAKKLLQEGRSVTDVAMSLSFSSSNYFSSVFRRYTAYSPSQYVELISKKE